MNNRWSKQTVDANKNTPAAVVSIGSRFITGLIVGLTPVTIASFFTSMSMSALVTFVGTTVAGATAAVAVGAALIVGLPMLVMGGIAGVIAYRKYKRNQDDIHGLQAEYNLLYSDVTSKPDDYITNTTDLALVDQAKQQTKDEYFDKVLYALTVLRMHKGTLNDPKKIAELENIARSHQQLLESRLVAENKQLISDLNASYDALSSTGKLTDKDIFNKTKKILENFDKISKLNFLSNTKNDNNSFMYNRSDYKKVLINNQQAVAAIKFTESDFHESSHKPWGSNRHHYFSVIRADYHSAGLGSALKTFATKTFNRASSFVGGFGLVVGISAAVIGLFSIPVTWPVLLACGLAAAAVGIASVYSTYILDRDQQAQKAALERRNEIAKNMQATHKKLNDERTANAKIKTAVNSAFMQEARKSVKLEKENTDQKKQLEDQDKIIADLRRQLAAQPQASVLSHVTPPVQPAAVSSTSSHPVTESHMGLLDHSRESPKQDLSRTPGVKANLKKV